MMEHIFDGGRLIVNDCRMGLRDVESEAVDLIIADPPYRLKSWKGFGRRQNHSYQTPPPEYAEWIPECRRVLKEHGSIFIFENPVNEYELMTAVDKAGFHRQPNLVWFVTFRASHPRKGWYNSHYEPIIWGTKSMDWYFDAKPLAGKGSDLGGDVYAHPAISINALVPGQKPEGLIKRFILCHTRPGDVVLDPFAGSCTTLRVAKDLGRQSIGFEINPRTAQQGIQYRLLDGVGNQTTFDATEE